MAGKPCIKGTRVTAEDISEALSYAGSRSEAVEISLPA
jgi:uncharacterized protein (DUF433 family)